MFIVNFFRKGLEWAGYAYKNANIVYLGLDNSGKTTLVNMLLHERLLPSDSSTHPHNLSIPVGNIRYNLFDLGGHLAARKIWHEYI